MPQIGWSVAHKVTPAHCLSLTAAAIVLVFIFAMYLLEATLVCKCWTFSVEVQENNFTQIKKKNNSRETLTCNQYQWPKLRNQGVSMMMLQWHLAGSRFVLGYT